MSRVMINSDSHELTTQSTMSNLLPILGLLTQVLVSGTTGTAVDNGINCYFFGINVLNCILKSGFDDLSKIADPYPKQIDKCYLFIGEELSPFVPPQGSEGISYPNWEQMGGLKQLHVTIYLKTGSETGYQYFTADSMKGAKTLSSFRLLSNSAVVWYGIDFLSESTGLDQLWIEGATIDTRTGWNYLVDLVDLKLIGTQFGSLELTELPLAKLKSLQLELSRIEGVNSQSADQLISLTTLSISVGTNQQLDGEFIRTLSTHLDTLLLSGFSIGNISNEIFPDNSKIGSVTLCNSSDTEIIGSSAFSSDKLTRIELCHMPVLSRIEQGFLTGSNNLLNITITNMPALTRLPESLGDWVRPKYVLLTNNPKLSEIPVELFEHIKEWGLYRPQVVDVRGTQLDTSCACQASYLAAMSTKNYIEIHSNCLKNWTENGMCMKGENCWNFLENCSYECLAEASPYSYSCICDDKGILLPDGYTCATQSNCSIIGVNELFCKQYNATCQQNGNFLICSCANKQIWYPNKLICAKNSLIPIATYTSVPRISTFAPNLTTALPRNSTNGLPVWEIAVIAGASLVGCLVISIILGIAVAILIAWCYKKSKEKGEDQHPLVNVRR